MNPVLLRFLVAIGLILLGMGIYQLVNTLLLSRASRKQLGLETFKPGIPGILYFTTPHCIPCITIQRPALAELKEQLGEGVQIIQVDAVEEPELAEYWGVLSVPTTFVIDSQGQPRRVNHGAARAEKLLQQLEEIEKQKLVKAQPIQVKKKEGYSPYRSN